MSQTKIYLASPLGFMTGTQGYLQRLKDHLSSQGFEILDPWSQDWSDSIAESFKAIASQGIRDAFTLTASTIGTANEKMIREADLLLAVLDGMEPDSGTVAELGFASALGKTVYGLRTDLRDAGDFPGVPLNLQVLHFINSSGGRLFRTIDEIQI
jgi:nucleoside 2-deoxyribosyltransferase